MRLLFLYIALVFYGTSLFANDEGGQSDQYKDSLNSVLTVEKTDSLRVKILLDLADHFVFTEPVSSIKYFDEAREILERGKTDSNTVALYHWKLGSFFWTQSIYDKALEQYNLALAIYQKQENWERIPTILNNIGEVYKKTGDLEMSLSYHKRVKELLEAEGTDYRLALNNINIGELFILMGMEDSASYYLKKGRDIARRNRNNRYMAYSFQYLGDISFNKGFYLDALSNYQQALILWKSRSDKRGEAGIYNRLAAVALEQQDHNRAERYIELAVEICKKEKLADLYLTALTNAIEMEKLRKNYKQALAYSEEYKIISDSLFSQEKRDQLLRIQTQLDLAELEKRNSLLAKENEITEERLQMQNDVVIFIILCLFISIGFLYGMIIQRKMAKKASKQLEKQQFSMEDQQAEILSQAQKLNELNAQLSELNANLEVKVAANTEEIMRQKQKIAEYAYLNAHKLRAPVASVIGLINLLEISREGKIDSGLVDHLKSCAKELDQVVTDIRDNLSEDVNPDISSISSKYDY